MKKILLSAIFMLSFLVIYSQTFRKVDINTGLNSNTIFATHSPFDLGQLFEVFDGNFESLARCSPVNNPMYITLEFASPITLGAARVLSAQEAAWAIEGAMVLNDLDTKTGSYIELANDSIFIENTYDSVGFIPTEVKFVRLTLKRIVPDFYPHLREWELYQAISPVIGDFAIQFDGTNDQVNTNLFIDQASGNSPVTFEAWVYPTSNSAGRHMVISSDNGNFDWSILREGNTWFVFNGNGSYSTGFSVDLNEWQHLAAVFIPGTGVKFYKNGVESLINNLGFESSYNAITIGENPGASYNEFFAGVIDEVRVWGVERTQSDIISGMLTKQIENEPGLLSAWHFDEGEGVFTLDSKGTYDATLINGPVWVTNVAPLTIDGHNLGIAKINAPLSSCFLENQENISITIRNAGTMIEDQISASYIFNGETFTETITDIEFEPNTTMNFTFQAPINLSGYGVFPLKIFLNTTDDQYLPNDSINISLERTQPFDYQITDNSIICRNTTINLEVSGGFRYQWENGSISSGITVSPTESSIYFVTIFGPGEGCFYNDSVEITVLPVPDTPLITADKATACIGDTITLTSSINTNIRWAQGVYTPSIKVTKNGSYQVIHTGNNGCLSISEIYNPTFVVKPGISSPMNAICRGDNLTLSATNAQSCTWSTGATTLSIQVSPSESQPYYLTAFNTPGCMMYDSIFVKVLEPLPPGQITNMLPLDTTRNVVTPVVFSWLPAENASLYDLYVWLNNTPRPISPSASNLTTINYRYYYYFLVDTMYNWQVVAKNSCFETESEIQHFITRQLPDLILDSIDIPNTGFSGDNVTLSWVTSNAGGATSGVWHDNIYLSQDQQLDEADKLLGSVKNDIFLNNGESDRQTASFQLPEGIQGFYNFIVKVNNYSYSFSESDISNNIKTSDSTILIHLTPPPDLQVERDIIIPADVFSSQDISISYSVINKGTGPTNGSAWKDWVYLSASNDRSLSDGILLAKSTHTGILKPDSSYTKTIHAVLPQGIYGNYYIHILTDFENSIYEFAFEENNWRVSDSMQVTLLPPPDLVFEEVIIPDKISIGEVFNIYCLIRNAGTGPTIEGQWIDSVYLWKNQAGTIKVPFEAKLHKGNIETGEYYNVTFQVQLPQLSEGNYFLCFKTDAKKQVYEFNKENNNQYVSLPLVIAYPDLNIQMDSLPDTLYSGQVTSIMYFSKNKGSGKLINQTWNDAVYISNQPTINTGSFLTDIKRLENIGSADSLRVGMNVKLPDGIEGIYYFYVKTDINNKIYEKNGEDNNVSDISVPVYIKLSDPVDLQVSNLTIPDTLGALESLPIIWTTTNSGSGTASPNWHDRVYISQSPTLDTTTATLIFSYLNKKTVATDEFYQKTYKWNINAAFSGRYYVHVITDWYHQVYEHTNENNNITSKMLYIKAYPPVDLLADSVKVPSLGGSGQKIQLSYVVQNIGQAKSINTYWYDEVYLSVDNTASVDDYLLANKNIHSGPLNPLEYYRKSMALTLPNGINGEYYVILLTDKTGLVNDINRINNQAVSLPIQITLSPTPDLQITNVTALQDGVSGQPIDITWIVENKSEGTIENTPWMDQVFLSANSSYDVNDIRIGMYSHTGNLKAFEKDSVHISADIPLTISGNYYLIVVTDIWRNIYEYDREGNNQAYSVVSIFLPPPSDLIVTDFNLPTNAIVGDSITISWKTVNQGENLVTGRIEEDLYLSVDELWDVDDVLICENAKKVNLSPGTYSESIIHTILPGVTPGVYHIIARTDIKNRIPEVNEGNNTGCSLGTIEVDMQNLQIGTPVSLSMNKYTQYYFKIEVTDSLAGEILSVNLLNNSPAVQSFLYLQYTKSPNKTNFDYTSTNPFDGDQEIIVPGLNSGTYYLLVLYEGEKNTQTVSLSATILPFELSGIYTNKGGSIGEVTSKITGSKLTTETLYQLSGNGLNIPATSTRNIDLLGSYVTFDLTAKPKGIYNLVAINPDGDTTILENGYEIVAGEKIGVSINLQHPASTRGTQIIALNLDFVNLSNVDILSPVVKIKSTSGSPIALDPDALSTTSPTTEMQLTLEELNGPTKILRAGQGGSITIYCISNPAPTFVITQIQ